MRDFLGVCSCPRQHQAKSTAGGQGAEAAEEAKEHGGGHSKENVGGTLDAVAQQAASLHPDLELVSARIVDASSVCELLGWGNDAQAAGAPAPDGDELTAPDVLHKGTPDAFGQMDGVAEGCQREMMQDEAARAAGAGADAACRCCEQCGAPCLGGDCMPAGGFLSDTLSSLDMLLDRVSAPLSPGVASVVILLFQTLVFLAAYFTVVYACYYAFMWSWEWSSARAQHHMRPKSGLCTAQAMSTPTHLNQGHEQTSQGRCCKSNAGAPPQGGTVSRNVQLVRSEGFKDGKDGHQGPSSACCAERVVLQNSAGMCCGGEHGAPPLGRAVSTNDGSEGFKDGKDGKDGATWRAPPVSSPEELLAELKLEMTYQEAVSAYNMCQSQLVSLYNALGNVHRDKGRHREAQDNYQTSMDLKIKAFSSCVHPRPTHSSCVHPRQPP